MLQLKQTMERELSEEEDESLSLSEEEQDLMVSSLPEVVVMVMGKRGGARDGAAANGSKGNLAAMGAGASVTGAKGTGRLVELRLSHGGRVVLRALR